MAEIVTYTIHSSKRDKWIMDIVNIRNEMGSNCLQLSISIDGTISRANIENYHVVTLSCLLDYAKRRSVKIFLGIKDTALKDYIFNDIRLRMYMSPEQNMQFSTPEQQPFNIWRIEEKYYTNYALALSLFFQNNFFRGKDLSGLHNCIVELFQNVIDHSQSNGTAFIAIAYNAHERQIDISICDFGVGIPYTLREQYSSEREALVNCLVRGVSAKTNPHNFGFGMDNVVSTMGEKDILRIVSNKALLLKTKEKEITYPLDFDFKGTLIYFTVPIDNFEDEEIIDQITF